MRTPLTLVAAAVVLAACTSTPPAAPPPPTSSAAPVARPCWEAVHADAIVTDTLIDNGCIDPNGAKRVGVVKTCKNGQRLWEMDGLMGLSGRPMIPADVKGEDGIPPRSLYEIVCKS